MAAIYEYGGHYADFPHVALHVCQLHRRIIRRQIASARDNMNIGIACGIENACVAVLVDSDKAV